MECLPSNNCTQKQLISDIVVTFLTVVCKILESNPTISSCVFIVMASVTYSLGNGLRTVTGVSMSTQPSTLCMTVKQVTAFRPSNHSKWDDGCK